LASALQLGDVVVTTKTDGESVANVVKLQSGGGIREKSRASHPTGTTLSVTNFMYRLPVRKKTLERESAKTLTKIRQLLFGFALARPSVRYSFKVIKVNKDSWTFSPRANDGIKEAVAQVVGRDASNQCVEKSFSFSDSRSKIESKDHDGLNLSLAHTPTGNRHDMFTLEAFLPKPGFDPSKVGKGQYISVDSRPVAYDKGTIKKIVALYTSYIKDTISTDSDRIKSPFIRLNLQCPSASYDPNIEPAKDDVLFENESSILESVHQFLKDVYGERRTIPKPVTRSSLISPVNHPGLLRNKRPISPPSSDAVSPPPTNCRSSGNLKRKHVESPSDISQGAFNGLALAHSETETNKCTGTQRRYWEFDMSSIYTEAVEGYERHKPLAKGPYRQDQTRIDNGDLDEDHEKFLSPWVIAKMTASGSHRVNPSFNLHPKHPNSPSTSTNPSFSPNLSVVSQIHEQTEHQGHTVTASFQRVSADIPHKINASPGHNKLSLPFGLSTLTDSRVESDQLPLAGEKGGNELAQKWDPTTSSNKLPKSVHPPAYTLLPNLNKTMEPSTKKANGILVSPFRLEAKSNGHPHLQQPNIRDASLQSLSDFTRQEPHQDSNSNSGSELHWAMDFEQRKEEATRRRREEIRKERYVDGNANSISRARSSPHKNRYNAAIARLDTEIPYSTSKSSTIVKEALNVSMPDDDPRAYLIRRKKSMALQVMKPGDPPLKIRTKSSRLPLETVSHNQHLHQQVQVSAANIHIVRKLALGLSASEDYIRHGQQFSGLIVEAKCADHVMKKTINTVDSWIESQGIHIKEGKNVEYIIRPFENLRNIEFLDQV